MVSNTARTRRYEVLIALITEDNGSWFRKARFRGRFAITTRYVQYSEEEGNRASWWRTYFSAFSATVLAAGSAGLSGGKLMLRYSINALRFGWIHDRSPLDRLVDLFRPSSPAEPLLQDNAGIVTLGACDGHFALN